MGSILRLVIFVAIVLPSSLLADRVCGRSVALLSRLTTPLKRGAAEQIVRTSQLPDAPESIEGFTSRKKYSTDWKLIASSNTLRFGFKSEEASYDITLKLAQDETDSNEIFLNLPRGREGNIEDVNLLAAVLEYIYRRSDLGDRFELVVNDPIVIEVLNQSVTDAMVATSEIPYEPRRATGSAEDVDFMDTYDWDVFADSYFPDTRPADGYKYLRILRNSESLAFKLNVDLKNTEFGTAILGSGDWLSRIYLVENPKFIGKQARPGDDGEVVATFPLQWRISLETQF